MRAWIDTLQKIDGITVETKHAMHQHLPMRVGGNADYWIRCSSRVALLNAMPLIRRKTWRVHWPFQDWLIKDGGIHGCVLRLEGEFEKVSQGVDHIELGTSALWSQTTGMKLSANELQYWPGSVGNVLSKDNFKLLGGFSLELEWLRGRKFETVTIEPNQSIDIPKTAIPTKIKLIGRRRRRKSRPLGSGFIFVLDKNKMPGSILEDLQLNSVRLRNWKVSKDNPNQIVHHGHGNFEDVALLQKALNQRIKQIRNSSLQFRIPTIGRK